MTRYDRRGFAGPWRLRNGRWERACAHETVRIHVRRDTDWIEKRDGLGQVVGDAVLIGPRVSRPDPSMSLPGTYGW